MALKQLSAAKYGRERGSVEREINTRMSVKAEALPASRGFGSAPLAAGPAAQLPPASNPTPPPKPGNFLDDWLSKRRPAAAGSAPAPTPVAAAQPAPPPVLPPAAPATPSPVPPVKQNISSDELDNKEIHEIATELKQQLDTPDSKKMAEQPEIIKKTEHRIDLQSGEKGDTIFIDRDGSFVQVKAGQAPPAR
jgi:hypothetical protein